jgi:sugar lactone lactonase YvrE
MVRELLTATGNTYANPPANYYRIAKDPTNLAETTAQLFFGVRMQCAKCHNHPFEAITQDDYYSTAAWFARVKTKKDATAPAKPNPQDPGAEVVFAVRDGEVTLVTDELEGPNGLAFSPDERYLYVGNWDLERKVVMRYEIDASGDAVGTGEVFYDMTDAPGEDAIDGIKVDRDGNLYVCGPGGIWILSPRGERLGLIELPEDPHNLAWGDADGRTLYITALTSVYRMRLTLPGVRPS